MINPLKQTILLSILGHVTVFSVFSFSFGPKIPAMNSTPVSFQGAILRAADLSSDNIKRKYELAAIRKSETLLLDKINRESSVRLKDTLKPTASFESSKDKIIFMPKLMLASVPIRKEPTIMFYPKLPYHFSLYFKDRQAAHIELMFATLHNGKRNSTVVKRKISSGNLEADLLSGRYISHYLFVRQQEFVPGNWQTVKIDLSALDD